MLNIQVFTFLMLSSMVCSSGAITFDQVDDFEAGSEAGWQGSRNYGRIIQVPDGGPEGSGDGFLEVGVTNFHLGSYNEDQWSGDFIEAGVIGVEFDAVHLNRNSADLHLRILIFGPGGAFATTRTSAISTNGWEHYSLSFASNDLVRVDNYAGSGNVDDTLSGVTKMLIRHDRDPVTAVGNHPPHVNEMVGLDNIHSIPRPPVIQQIEVKLSLADLVAGQSNVVQSADNLVSNEWSDVISFMAGGTETNLTFLASDESAFYRVLIP